MEPPSPIAWNASGKAFGRIRIHCVIRPAHAGRDISNERFFERSMTMPLASFVVRFHSPASVRP
jgi:hypothetical protein